MNIEKPQLNEEFNVNLPVVPNVEHNLDVIDKFATELKIYYDNYTVTKENREEAKDEKAKVNNLLKEISDRRKEVTKVFEKPLNSFLETSKRIENTLKTISDDLKEKLDVFTNEEKDEKAGVVLDLIEELKLEYEKTYPNYKFSSDTIQLNPKWLNKTFKKSDIINEVKEQFDEQVRDLDLYMRDSETIMNFFNALNDNTLNKSVYIERYKHTRDVNQVIKDIQTDYDASKVTNVDNIFASTTEEVNDPFAGLSVNNVILTKEECKKQIIEIITLSNKSDDIKKQLISYVEEVK